MMLGASALHKPTYTIGHLVPCHAPSVGRECEPYPVLHAPLATPFFRELIRKVLRWHWKALPQWNLADVNQVLCNWAAGSLPALRKTPLGCGVHHPTTWHAWQWAKRLWWRWGRGAVFCIYKSAQYDGSTILSRKVRKIPPSRSRAGEGFPGTVI